MEEAFGNFVRHPIATYLLAVALAVNISAFAIPFLKENHFLSLMISSVCMALAFFVLLLDKSFANLPLAVLLAVQSFVSGTHFSEYRRVRNGDTLK